MARDIRALFEEDQKVSQEKMPENHQGRFLEKLDKAYPNKGRATFNWLNIAASIVLLLGLGFGAHTFFQPQTPDLPIAVTKTTETKTLGDVSPGLKKVEDYYLASINLELSKMKYTPETKDLFDGYLEQLNELNMEYDRLSVELTQSGPSELTVNALIDNLKYRLNLLYRLKEQLNKLNTSGATADEVKQTI